jgi:OmpA-OmpF porin, OOP family
MRDVQRTTAKVTSLFDTRAHVRQAMRLATVGTMASLWLGTESPAQAQTFPTATNSTNAASGTPSIDVRQFRPSSDPSAGFSGESANTAGHLRVSLGSWLSYSHNQVVIRRANGDLDVAPLAHAVHADLTANVGIGSRVSLGFGLPLLLWQDGAVVAPSCPCGLGQSTTVSGVGDLQLTGKFTVIPLGELGGFGAAVLGNATLPTGPSPSFANEAGVTAGGTLLAEYSLLLAGAQLQLGYQARTKQSRYPEEVIDGTVFGDYTPFRFALWVRPKFRLPLFGSALENHRFELGVRGALPAGPAGPFGSGEPGSAKQTPVLMSFSDRIPIALGKGNRSTDLFVQLGLEWGLTTAFGVPTIRGVASLGYTFGVRDRDGDGVPDERDQCLDVPEDRDGFEDDDGCPDIDDDNDGIDDANDACPRKAGPRSSDPKKNGCPPPDTDGDGIPDSEDSCPRIRGPRNPSDASCTGCPVTDQDGDGIEDLDDRCPYAPGPSFNFGCPSPTPGMPGSTAAPPAAASASSPSSPTLPAQPAPTTK